MSSFYDVFGNGPENYDDDPDGVEVERREVEEDQQRNPHAYGLPCPGCNYHALDEAIAEVSERMEKDGVR
jgi:hypothetical protein